MKNLFAILCLTMSLGAQDLIVPTVTIPTVALPESALPAPEVPVLTVAEPGVSSVALSSVELPEVAGSNVAVSTVAESSVALPEIAQSVIIVSEVIAASVTTPVIRSAAIDLPGEIDDLTSKVADAIAFAVLTKTLFADQRGLLHDATANALSASFAAWVEIYEAQARYIPRYVALSGSIRMIAEARVSHDYASLVRNLAFYRVLGYNAVLAALDGSEQDAQIEEFFSVLRKSGMKIYFAFSSVSNSGELAASVFPEPGRYASLLRYAATAADGFLLGWRRTSSHYFLQDRAWSDYTLAAVRSGNPKIELVGEIYFGQTAASSGSIRSVTGNIPVNMSGAVLNGLGFYGVDAKGAIAKARIRSSLPLLGVILGETPKYLSHSNRDFSGHLAIKRALEERYLTSGCAGTITLHSDGSNDNLSIQEVKMR